MEHARIRVCYQAQQRDLEPYEISQAFLDFRGQLQAAAGPERQAFAGPADAGGDDPWPLISCLGWGLQSERVLAPAQVEDTLENLDPADLARLAASLARWAEILGRDPYLATKKWGHRLQFAALGREWVETLQKTPSLADFLENEIQPVDLERLLVRRGCY